MMSPAERITGYRLLAAAGAVPFRIVSQEVLNAPDPAEFGMRIDIRFQMDDEDLECDADELIEHTAFGFIFAIAVLSFADARPREESIADFVENDEFQPSDLLQCLSFKAGELHFYADYARGRRIKTDIVLRGNGTATLQTFGRGRAAIRWLEQLQGKYYLELVENPYSLN